MKRLMLLSLFVSGYALAEGYYYPVPANPKPLQYVLPPSYIVPPQQNNVLPPVYVAPSPPAITPGKPPVFVPFDTGRLVPRGGNKED